MLARAHATTSGASPDLGGRQDGDHGSAALLLVARYLDVVLVIASAPIVFIAGLPVFGYVLAAAGWIVVRFAVEMIKRRAWSAQGTGIRAVLHLTAIFGRVWMIALVILVARFAGHNSDGICAAVVVLAAFTVELTISVLMRAQLAAEAGSRA
jgi:hypothetical protein